MSIREIASAALFTTILLFYLPLIPVIYFAISGGELKLPLKIILNTLALAGATAITTTVIAYPVAYYLSKAGKPYEFTLVLAPLWIGVLIKSFAILSLYNLMFHYLHVDVYGTFIGVLIAMIYEYLPYSILLLYASISRISSEYIDAARNLGASRIEAFLRVELPLSMPGIISSIIFVLLLAMGEMVIPATLGGNKIYTVGLYIWDLYFKSRAFAPASALALILSVLASVSALLIFRKIRGLALL